MVTSTSFRTITSFFLAPYSNGKQTKAKKKNIPVKVYILFLPVGLGKVTCFCLLEMDWCMVRLAEKRSDGKCWILMADPVTSPTPSL